jgi:PAS domain S-box-containing protein
MLNVIDHNPLIVAPQTLLSDAIALMNKAHCSRGTGYILVAIKEQLMGILTKTDLVRLVANQVDLSTTSIDKVMTQPVITLNQDSCKNPHLVWTFLQQHSINYLPILDNEQKLVGIIDADRLIRSLNCHNNLLVNDETNEDFSSQWRSSTELELFFNLNLSLFCIAGFDGYFKRINPAFEEVLGFTKNELLTRPFINFVHPEDRAATVAEVEHLMAGQTTVSFENRYLTRDGRYRWLLWTARAERARSILYAAAQDITERKKSELALKENEERWQLALKGANDGIWDWNVKTNEVFFSRRWKQMLGFADNEINNTLEEWSKRVHPDDLGWVTQVIQDHFAGKTPFYISEHRVLCKDGSYKWILDRGQALWNEAGQVIRMAGSHTDITERKQDRERLAKSENLLRLIISSEPEWVNMLDREGNLQQINPAGLAIVEADSLGDVKGKSIYPLIKPHHRQAFIDLTERVFKGESGKLEFELTGLKGTSRWLETHAVPLKDDGNITALLAVTRDITQRKQAELQLQQERDFSNAVLDTVGALIAVIDREGRIVRFNHTCEQITGYSWAEVKGKLIWEFLITPEERNAVKTIFEDLIAGQVPNQYENYWLAKNGSRHLISWSNSALTDSQGNIEFVIATGIDITQQRQVWNQLERQYRQTKLLAEITRKIRMSLDLNQILPTTVNEVRQILACDRVLIMEIRPNDTAIPIGESVLPELTQMLGYELADPLLMGEYLARYRQGEILAINDLEHSSVSIDVKHLLKQFEVKAKLVVPILSQSQLKGLLIAHQCYNTRKWQEHEIQLLTQLGDQIGVALSQAQLLNNLEELVAQRTNELSAINNRLQVEIEERKQTESVLRENQQKLAGILDNADEAIISIDRQQQIQLFNQGAERIFGYRAEEVMGRSLDILLPEGFRQIHRQHVANFEHSSKRSQSMAERSSNVCGLRRDGTEFPAEASIAKLELKEGALFTVMLKDITERQQAKAKLQASRSLLAKAEVIAKIGSWEYDHQAKIESWSDELFNILEFDKEAGIPLCQQILDRVHPDDRSVVKKTLIEGHRQGKAWELNYRLLLSDGRIKYLESRGEPTLDAYGKVVRVLETIMDVSERIYAEQSLQRSEQQLSLITDALPILIAYIDNCQRYRYVNRTYETWFGKSSSSFSGLTIEEVQGESNYQKMLPYIEMALSGKSVTFEIQPVSENGSLYWVSATYIPDFDINGRVKGFFSMVDDITERKAVEQIKSEFVSIASHEMRTPLTSIHGVLKLLCANRLGELSPPGITMANMALRNSDRLVHLIDDLLDLERMESGKDRINKQPCQSANLILQAVDTVNSMAQQQEITIVIETNLSIEFMADSDRLVQTLVNLLSNAIKFSTPGSKVWVNSYLEDDVVFTVRDRGRGIPQDQLETIFERFQQVDASDSRHKGGTGLGLAICRHIVGQHGGRIWAESICGEGSTFYFKIPR